MSMQPDRTRPVRRIPRAEPMAVRTNRAEGRSPPFARGTWSRFEVEVIPGLEEFVERELRARLEGHVEIHAKSPAGRIAITYAGDPRRLNDLRTAVAVYAVATFDVPRPTGLLGQQHFDHLRALANWVMALSPRHDFATFRLSAAGSDTSAFQRLKAEIGNATHLSSTDEHADLAIAVRRPPDGSPGWQALVRLSPRPLSARAWRRCNWPGALNATIAHVIVGLAKPSVDERFLNLACGSGTLLVERLSRGPANVATGLDIDEQALACARLNLEASGYASQATLLRADARHLPFPATSFDTIVTDLPFGMLVGSKAENERLYPPIMREATRVATADAAMVVMTASTKLFEAVLREFEPGWTCLRRIPLKLSFPGGYLSPRIYVLRRVTTG
jgi:tRNA (guanine6-N2)-methyltransferase